MAFRVNPNIRVWGDRKSQLGKQCQKTHYTFSSINGQPGITASVNYLVNTGIKRWGNLISHVKHKTRANGCLLRVYVNLRSRGPGNIMGYRIRFDCVSKYDGFYLFQIHRSVYRRRPPCDGPWKFSWTWKLTNKAKRYY